MGFLDRFKGGQEVQVVTSAKAREIEVASVDELEQFRYLSPEQKLAYLKQYADAAVSTIQSNAAIYQAQAAQLENILRRMNDVERVNNQDPFASDRQLELWAPLVYELQALTKELSLLRAKQTDLTRRKGALHRGQMDVYDDRVRLDGLEYDRQLRQARIEAGLERNGLIVDEIESATSIAFHSSFESLGVQIPGEATTDELRERQVRLSVDEELTDRQIAEVESRIGDLSYRANKLFETGYIPASQQCNALRQIGIDVTTAYAQVTGNIFNSSQAVPVQELPSQEQTSIQEISSESPHSFLRGMGKVGMEAAANKGGGLFDGYSPTPEPLTGAVVDREESTKSADNGGFTFHDMGER